MNEHVIRGGSHIGIPRYMHSANRDYFNVSRRLFTIGVRLVEDVSDVTGSSALRGGSWDDDPNDLRSVLRYWDTIGLRSSTYGFRLIEESKNEQTRNT